MLGYEPPEGTTVVSREPLYAHPSQEWRERAAREIAKGQRAKTCKFGSNLTVEEVLAIRNRELGEKK